MEELERLKFEVKQEQEAMEEEEDDALNDYDTARYVNGASSNPNRIIGRPLPVSAKLERRNSLKKAPVNNDNKVASTGVQKVAISTSGKSSIM